MSLWLAWATYPEVVSRRVNKRGREKEKKEKEEGGREEERGERKRSRDRFMEAMARKGNLGTQGTPPSPRWRVTLRI